jgi:hypothetical protein
MLAIEKSVEERSGIRFDEVPEWVFESTEPLLLKGIVAEWPIVRAARESPAAADRYIRQFYRNASVVVFSAPPEAKGRIFYNEDLTGFNFQRAKVKLDTVLDKLERHLNDKQSPAFYVGSTAVDVCLPGFRAENDVEFGGLDPLTSIWLGNQTRIAAHYDLPDNMACCVAGRRKFILFPPGELENLYVGPLDFTPAGQAISLVDFHQPDFERHPKFRTALQNARVAQLEPGDAIFIPSMWWHHVESLDPFNVLINYWWRQSPGWMGAPVNALDHALLCIRDLPEAQRRAWQEIFRFYVFEFEKEATEHIPEHSRGVLSPIDDETARKLRAQLLNRLNR